MINTLARSFYYPSLGYNVLLEKIGYTQWWNEVEVQKSGQTFTLQTLPAIFLIRFFKLECCIISTSFVFLFLGALPFSSMLARMKAEGVTRVISLNERHELKSGILKLPKLTDYEAYDIERIEINVCDFTGAPSIEEIEKCLSFIESSQGKIYVHCKAGRCRSALIVAAAKVKFEGKTPRQAYVADQ